MFANTKMKARGTSAKRMAGIADNNIGQKIFRAAKAATSTAITQITNVNQKHMLAYAFNVFSSAKE